MPEVEENNDDKSRSFFWRKAMIGPLPPDFLRIGTLSEQQMQQQQQQAVPYYQLPQAAAALNHVGRLSITCVQARLARNYGLTRMDPYVRIRVGHYVYETQTDPNGGKNPRWNRAILSQLPRGVTTISIEIYDECSFKMDELIAWAKIEIPERVLNGETFEGWFPLSGKQGEGQEGSIEIVLSFSNQPLQPYVYQTIAGAAPIFMMPPGRPLPLFTPTQQHPAVNVAPVPPPPVVPLSEADLKQISEMFPNIDNETIKSVAEANRGNKEATINSLLQMTE